MEAPRDLVGFLLPFCALEVKNLLFLFFQTAIPPPLTCPSCVPPQWGIGLGSGNTSNGEEGV